MRKPLKHGFPRVRDSSPPDLLVTGGEILNVYTGEILPGDIVISGPLIRYVGPPTADSRRARRVIQAKGSYVIPGFFDPHAHTDVLFNPASFSNQTILTGTTSVFSDSHDLATSLGPSGFKKILKDFDKYPVKFFSGIPATSPPFPGLEGTEIYKMAHFKDLVKDPVVFGVSEVSSWIRLLDSNEDLIARIELTRRLGKRVEGHTLGASFEKLNRLAYQGITSCHEALSPEDVIKRLRVGLFVMLRHGSIRSDLRHLAMVFKQRPFLSLNRIMLTPDTMLPRDIITKGYMDHLVREAIRYGIDPIPAIRMATLNPASYFGLDHLLGGIAPGRLADLLLVRDLTNPTPHLVIERGRAVARDGALTIPPAPAPTIGTEGRPFRIKTVPKKWLEIHTSKRGTIRVPAIHILDKTVTGKKEVTMPIREGLIHPDHEQDVLLICLIQRDGKRIGRGFLSGFGLRGGAASSLCHDIHNLMVIGHDFEDMRLAADEVLRMGGGIALVKDRKLLRALPLPIGGIMSPVPIADLAREVGALERVFRRMGSHLEDPFLTMSFLSFTSILDLRITVSGVYSVKEGKVVF